MIGYQDHKRYYNNRTQADVHPKKEMGIDGKV